MTNIYRRSAERLRQRARNQSIKSIDTNDNGASKSSTKMMNLHSLNEYADQMMTVLGEFGSEPELKAAIGVLVSFKMLLKSYSDRLRETPFKSVIKKNVTNTRYGDYFNTHEFDDAQSVFNAQEEKKRKRQDKREKREREQERDNRGRFA